MSAVGAGEVLKPILLRSSTPAPNEKVLNYLEGMSREGHKVDNSPPRSMLDHEEYRSRTNSKNGTMSPKVFSPLAKSRNGDLLEHPASPVFNGNGNGNGHIDQQDFDDDADSNVQEGRRSEDGGTALPVREPGPHDPPGPKYESYDSGPSFGNFGPLPTDDNTAPHPFAQPSWTPAWNQTGRPSSNPPKSPNPDSRARGSQAPSRASQKSPSMVSNPNMETAGAARTPSRANGRSEDNRPLSPQSRVTNKTRGTDKGTRYPPLPESRIGDDDDAPLSPGMRSQLRHKTASISPSESPSQVRYLQTPSRTPSRKEGSGDQADMASRAGSRLPNGSRSQAGPPSVMSGGGGGHQSRPFSPYRHAPTTEDLIHAAARGRTIAIPEEDENSGARTAPSQHSKPPSVVSSHQTQQSKMASARPAKTSSQVSVPTPPSPSKRSNATREGETTPRGHEPLDLDEEEAHIVNQALASRTPRTSYYAASTVDPETAGHYHDMELCVLLRHEGETGVPDLVKKALRKAVKQRIKRLGMKYDNESIKAYKRTHHDHDPNVHLQQAQDLSNHEPPAWAADLKRELVVMQQRIESLGPKIDNLKSPQGAGPSFAGDGSRFQYGYEGDDYTPRTPMTQTVNIRTQTGTMADSMYQPGETEILVDENPDDEYDDRTEKQHREELRTDGETRTQNRSLYAMSDRDDSPGQQHLEEELYRLRQRGQGSQSVASHRTWIVARDEEEFNDQDGENEQNHAPPTIPDTNGEGYPDRDRSDSPPLPALPTEEEGRELVTTPQPHWQGEYSHDVQQLPPWQRIQQRLLSWAIIWPLSDLDHALNSTTRGHQVDEVALTIWSTQAYKRYVRVKLTDSPQGMVDRLFVPPNIADAISTAVFNGRHGDACGMLRDLWSPFGLEGIPRLLVVLARHRSEENHWVVHRFSLPDGSLTTYDSYPERTLPDGRPLGWWFAIRVAWPNAMYPNPDHLMQKMVRLHRPLQLPIDNSVAAAGIWRNILMGSRAERSVDLERLRDLINTEVTNLRRRKELGKLSIAPPRPTWEDMN